IERCLAYTNRLRQGLVARNETVDVRVADEDGNWHWFETNGHDLTDDPSVGGLVFTSRHACDRHHLAELVARSEARVRAVVGNLFGLVVVVRANPEMRYASRGFAAQPGRPADGRILRRPQDNIHPDDLEHAISELATLATWPASKAVFNARLLHADGTWR